VLLQLRGWRDRSRLALALLQHHLKHQEQAEQARVCFQVVSQDGIT
jgi:hypothetical protein